MWELIDRARISKTSVYLFEAFEDVVIKIQPDGRFFVKLRGGKPFESHYRTSNMLYDILLEQNAVEITKKEYRNFGEESSKSTISVINKKLCDAADAKIKKTVAAILKNRRNRKFDLEVSEDGQGKFHLSKKTKGLFYSNQTKP